MVSKRNNKYFWLTCVLGILLLLLGASDILRDPIPGISLFLMAIGGNTIAVFAIVFPLLSCIPILLEFISELESGFFWYRVQRTEKGKILRRSYWLFILKGGGVLAIPSLLIGILSLIIKFGQKNNEIRMDINFLPDLIHINPLGYVAVIVCNIFLCGIVCASLGMGIYMFFRNRYIAFVLPFVYYLFSGIVLFEISPNLSLTLLYNINVFGMKGIEIRFLHALLLFLIGALLYKAGVKRGLKSE